MGERKHQHALQAGYKLHWYEVKAILGRGGFGITYLAHDSNLNRLVAIKEYLPLELALRDSTDSVRPIDEDDQEEFSWGLERFIREAQTLARFQHANIIKVISVFEANNTGYMVMEYEAGQELQTLIKGKGAIEEGVLMGVLIPLIQGLEIVHESGFIHRDIKPQNILIRPDGSPVLIDFGSARQALGDKTKTLTSLVTPGYAPYEQYHSKGDKQGPWTDIYALAAVMYRCILGRPPMSAVDRSESIIEGTGDLFISAKEIGGKSYTTAFLKAIDHGLQFKPTDRPRSLSKWKKEFAKAKPRQPLLLTDEASIPTEAVLGDHLSRYIEKKPSKVRFSYLSKTVTMTTLVILIVGITLVNKDKLLSLITGEQEGAITQSSSPKDTSLTPAEIKANKITALNSKAGQAEKEGRFLTPARDNAYYYYQEILALDPANPEAKRGIDNLNTAHFEKIDQAIDKKSFKEAEEILKELKPNVSKNTRYQSLLEKLKSERKAHKVVLAEKKKLEEEALKEKQREEKINQLLTSAKSDIEALRLTSPKGNNALEKYQEILTTDPGHNEANSGIVDIASRYIELANQLAEKEAFEKAYELLEIAENITPNAENIAFEKNAIDLQKKTFDEKEALKQQELQQQEEIAHQEAEQKSMEVQKQAELANYKPGTVIQDTLPDGSKAPEMIVVPAGEFQMGDTAGDGLNDEKPAHKITISQPFAVSKFEIRFTEYEKFAHIAGRLIPEDKRWGRLTRPVINVSWYDAVAYTEWLSEQTGHQYRLLSEAEWEYIARAGTQTKYWWGNELGKNRANCNGCGSEWDYKETAPIGSFSPNPFGLHDTAGNVREWTMDCWNSNYSGAPVDGTAWLNGDCERRVVRGGAWSNEGDLIRSSYRTKSPQTNKFDNQGFRIMRELY